MKLFSYEISIIFVAETILYIQFPIQLLTLTSADLINKAEPAEMSSVRLKLWCSSFKDNKEIDTVPLPDSSSPISRWHWRWQGHALSNACYDSMVMAYFCYFFFKLSCIVSSLQSICEVLLRH